MSQEPPSVNEGESDESKSAASPEQEHEGARTSAAEVVESADGLDLAAKGQDDSEARAASDDRGGASSREAPTEDSLASTAAEDDSLDAILLEASRAASQESSLGATKSYVGSRTLMGVGIDGLMLSNRGAPQHPESDSESDDRVGVSAAEASGETEGNTPEIIESKAASALLDDEKPTTSLLEDVANALAAQATEFRDKARGRLPGMPVSGSPAPSSAARFGGAQGVAEFEDPDEDKTSLTPAMIPVVEEAADFVIDTDLRADSESDTNDDADAEAADADAKLVSGEPPALVETPIEAAVVTIAASKGADKAADKDTKPDAKQENKQENKQDSKPTRVPPVPGLSLSPAPAPVGPPPGAPLRVVTPPTGLASTSPSGRVRLPTPGPGVALPTTLPLPAPPVGRTTLPPGAMMSPLASAAASADLTATSPSTPISIEASRRISEAVATTRGSRSGRVSSRGSVQVTEPILRASSAGASLPAILNAHVKLATLNLAGLIALTFAGGLFVGMLVWRGQGRVDAQQSAHPTVAAQPAPAPAQPAIEPVGGAAKTEAVANAATTQQAAGTSSGSTAGTATAAAMLGSAAALVKPTSGPATSPSGGEPGGAVAAADAPAGTAPSAKKPVATRTAIKPRRVASSVDEAGTDTASPPVATNPVATKPATAQPAKTAPAAKPTLAAKPAAASLKPAAFHPAPVAVTPAPSAASKAVATNSPAKPAAKTKAKTAWHDPFAD